MIADAVVHRRPQRVPPEGDVLSLEDRRDVASAMRDSEAELA
jgi:hypothetical protein